MSAKPILYYVPYSPPARAVLLCAEALDLDLELRVVDLKNGEHKQTEFLKMNPQHTVPTLDDNGKFLWDSHAIMTYLIAKYSKTNDNPLYPNDPYTRARIDQRLHFESGILFSSLLGLLRPTVYEGATSISERQWLAVHLALEAVETFLAVDPYLVGDRLTVADFSVITTVTQLMTQMELDPVKYPKLIAYVQRMETLPYFDDINTKNLATFYPLMEFVRARNKAAAAASVQES